MLELFSLPHSSANVERIFSQMNLSKTKVRNSLKEGTLNGILSSKEVIGSDNSRKKSCFEFKVTPGMIKKHCVDMYEKKVGEGGVQPEQVEDD